MADGDQITAEEYATWIPASEALNRVAKVMQHEWGLAAAAIVRRLNAGLVRAHIKTGNVERAGKTQKLKDFVAVPSSVVTGWTKASGISTLQFWVSGDAEVHQRISSGHGYDATQILHLFGIRFDPAGIAEMIPSAGPARAATAMADKLPVKSLGPPDAAPLPPAREQESKGPPVSSKALAAWYEAYKLAFTGMADTEAAALESARGCFPGKTVSRDAVRKLRGSQPRGRKSAPAK